MLVKSLRVLADAPKGWATKEQRRLAQLLLEQKLPERLFWVDTIT